MESKVVLRKALGIFLLVITAGIASCQAFFYSWTADANYGSASRLSYYDVPSK